MAIPYPQTFPTLLGIESMDILAQSAVSVSKSPWTFQQKVQVNTGQWWTANIVVPLLGNREKGETYASFIMKMNGQVGTFTLGIPGSETPRGVGTGTPLVDGGAQSGNSIDTKGWTTGITGILKAGDYFHLGSGATTRLYKVLSDANSDGSGLATFDIWPSIRQDQVPADNAPITINNALGLWRLASSDMRWTLRSPLLYSVNIAIIEAL